jgi:STE24 endopeptidase
MPILLVFLVAAASLQVPWPEPRFGPADDPRAQAELALAATVCVAAVPLVGAYLLAGWVVRALTRDRLNRPAVARVYFRVRRGLGYANLFAAAAAVVGGWGWAVWHGFPALLVRPFGPDVDYRVLCPGAELLVPLPYFAAVILGWVIYFPAERALHDTTPAVLVAADPPKFWSFVGYLSYNARQFVLFLGMPAGLFAAQQGAARVLPELAASGWLQIGWAAVIAGLLLLMPLAVRPLLGLVPVPPGPVRDRLEATARRLGFRYNDLLLWPTRGAVANAMVLGIVPRVRFVVFTDRLLAGMEPDELDAVLGHEVGHVRHGHIPFYAGFFLVSSAVATAAAVTLERVLKDRGVSLPPDAAGWMGLPPVAGMGAYLFAVFGLLSRRCERQADVFGGRAGSCGDPGCTGHDAGTVLVERGRGLCPTGARALINALERVEALNGSGGGAAGRGPAGRAWAVVRAWQHGPIRDRVEFLHRVAADPSLGDRTDRRVNLFRWGLLAGLLGSLAVLGSVVGWVELWLVL